MDTNPVIAFRTFISQLGINAEQAVVSSQGGVLGIRAELEISPEDFVQRAEDDFELGGSAALLNSATNAKRAIRCQVNRILSSVGYDPAAIKIKQKLDLIGQLGFLRPRLLRKVDAARNLLEHEYKCPTIEAVEETIELAALFVEASSQALKGFKSEFSIGNENDYLPGSHVSFHNELSFGFSDEKKEFQIRAYKGQRPDDTSGHESFIGRTLIRPSDAIFNCLIRLSIYGDSLWEGKKKQALADFFSQIQK